MRACVSVLDLQPALDMPSTEAMLRPRCEPKRRRDAWAEKELSRTVGRLSLYKPGYRYVDQALQPRGRHLHHQGRLTLPCPAPAAACNGVHRPCKPTPQPGGASSGRLRARQERAETGCTCEDRQKAGRKLLLGACNCKAICHGLDVVWRTNPETVYLLAFGSVDIHRGHPLPLPSQLHKTNARTRRVGVWTLLGWSMEAPACMRYSRHSNLP